MHYHAGFKTGTSTTRTGGKLASSIFMPIIPVRP
jgi:hypothetical protein